MSECSLELKRTVPLRKVVAGAIIDTYEDIGRVEQMYSHWAARGLKKLDRETLKTGLRKVTLTVNRNTNTATLPPDFHEEKMVALIVNGKKVPLKIKADLVDLKGIEDIPCEDSCPRCGQDKNICKELTITQETVLDIIEGQTYERTIIKKLEANGNYYLETKIPVWDVETESVVYRTTKEYITTLDMKPCGCVAETDENVEKIKCCNYDVYCSYFTSCDTSCSSDYGGYRIFEETGVIQFDRIGRFTKVYLEYYGFMPKVNGQYHVPEVAFETLIEWVKFMAIDAKPNVPNIDKRWRWDRYRIERDNMLKILCRISISRILYFIGVVPKFDINEPDTIECSSSTSDTSTSNGSTSSSTSATDCDTNGSEGACPICPPGTASWQPFSIAEIAGVGAGPVDGLNTYQNDKLKGATGIVVIFVNNTPETERQQQFSIDYTTGTLSRFQGDGVTPNPWFSGDVLAIPTFFKLI